MSFDAYIKIEDIPGEALDNAYKNCIEITGYSIWNAPRHVGYRELGWRRVVRQDLSE